MKFGTHTKLNGTHIIISEIRQTQDKHHNFFHVQKIYLNLHMSICIFIPIYNMK